MLIFLVLKLVKLSKANSSEEVDFKSLWQSLWKAKAPSNSKICCLRIINDIFSTKYNLSNKGVHSDLLCVCFAKSMWKPLLILFYGSV